MSNFTKKAIHKPQNLSFELQKFANASICWFSGTNYTFKKKFSKEFHWKITPQEIRLLPSIANIATKFYKFQHLANQKNQNQKLSSAYVQILQSSIGALVGFKNFLRVRGVGYRFQITDQKLIIHVGYSHTLEVKLPLNLNFTLNKKSTFLRVKSSNLAKLSNFLSYVRNLRQPDVYKGKGIRYKNDPVKLKEGKKKKQLKMSTLSQILKKKRQPRKYKEKRPDLQKCPQKKATCLKVFNMTPRKPNSALRKVAWVLLSNYRRVHAYIPGMSHNTLQKHSIALVRGGRVKDLPGMKYTIIRGKFDLQRLHLRRKARSKYGGKKIYTRVDHSYRKHKYW